MSDRLPLVLVPGLLCTTKLYEPQMPALTAAGPVMIADHTRADRMQDIARQILADAPPRFALCGLSMGGYISFEIVRQAPERVMKLALLDTMARPEQPAQSERRRALIALAQSGRFSEVPDQMVPQFLHPRRQNDAALVDIVRTMAGETGPEVFVRQQTAIMGRPDSRPTLKQIRCPTLVLVGDADALVSREAAEEMAEAIAGARLVVVPDCGHLSTLEQPEAVTQALMDWMAL